MKCHILHSSIIPLIIKDVWLSYHQTLVSLGPMKLSFTYGAHCFQYCTPPRISRTMSMGRNLSAIAHEVE